MGGVVGFRGVAELLRGWGLGGVVGGRWGVGCLVSGGFGGLGGWRWVGLWGVGGFGPFL